jgi:hypothetical protein
MNNLLCAGALALAVGGWASAANAALAEILQTKACQPMLMVHGKARRLDPHQ